MRRVGLFNFFGLLLLAAIVVGFSTYLVKDREEFESLRLSYAVDFSTDASLQSLLETGDLGLDYAASGRTTLDPVKALDTFVNVFLMNYNMNLNEENRAHVRGNFMPVFTVATFDGYYMAQSRLVKSDTNYPEEVAKNQDWDLVFSPKMPYKYVNGTTSYALNMAGDYYLSMQGNNLEKLTGFPTGLTSKSEVLREINKILSTDISYAIDNINKENVNWRNTFYIPTALTSVSGVQSITGPSVIAMIQNCDFVASKPLSSFSIGGGKLHNVRTVNTYIRNGIKYYCFSDQFLAINPMPVIIETLTSPKEAALLGYSADLTYMQN